MWDTCDKSLKDKLQMLQNRAVKVITGANYDASPNIIFQKLNFDTVNVRRVKLKSVIIVV